MLFSTKLTCNGRPVIINPDLVTYAIEAGMQGEYADIYFSGAAGGVRVEQKLGVVLQELNRGATGPGR